VQGLWTETEKELHINVLELVAAWRVLEAFVQHIENSHVMIASDNTTTVAYIRKQGGTRSQTLLEVTQEFYTWLEIHQITVGCRHIAGRLNVLADSLSRAGEILPTEWSLHPRILDRLWEVWDKPLVDMFATSDNCKLPIYVSPIPDPQAMAVDALIVNRVDKSVYVLFPSDSDSQQGTGQDASSPLCSYTDSTSLAQAKMVSRHSRDAGGLPSGTSAVAEIATTTQVVNLSPQARSVSSSRLEIIQRSHSHRGFSEEASHRMARAQKASSIAVYEGKWKAFTHWCKERNANPLKADAQLVADFLCHLHNEKKLAYSTIEGYRTAIRSTVLAARSEDINGDQRLSALMANFARDRSKRKSSIPNWDLSLVLLMLTKQPFEPMHKASIKHVTWKTVFLVALASGKRRGELHAIRREILHTKDWRSVTLVPDTEFVAKTELGNKGADVLKPITFPALTKLLDASMQEDRSLCPVRAIKQYLQLTKESRGPRRKLFIAYKAGWDNTKEIHANTVSTWIKKVILMAYENASEEDKRVMKVTAHQVRGMAASWALHRNVAMEAVMDACSWKAHNTFTQYYLKDLALISEEMYHLGPVIAAQHSA
jgi:integrase